MYKKKYHIIWGIVCLAIIIVLPTLIYNYYLQVENLGGYAFYYSYFEETVSYGLIVLFSFLWLASLLFALRELGGYVIQLGNDNYDDGYLY